MPQTKYKDSGASISPCGAYRYSLWRWWGEGNGQKCTFIMLNPSTADGKEDDPTIRRCVGFAKDWGYSGVTVVNLFPLRATNPTDLIANIGDTSPGSRMENNQAIVAAAVTGGCIVCAWGAHGNHTSRDREVGKLLTGFKLECLGQTQGGQPRHPLYLPKDTTRRPLTILSGAEAS